MPESEDAVLLQRRARRRLVGAIALVVFVVIVLPIVFDREPRPITQDLAIEIPSQDSGKFSPRMVPPAAPPTQPSKASAGPAAKESVPETPKPAAETLPPAPPASAPQTAKTSAAEVSNAAPKAVNPAHDQSAQAPRLAESFVVPLGAYSNPVNARQIQSRVAAAGYKAYSQSVKVSNGTQLRVRAGPFPTREAAERAREKLKSLGFNPVGAVAVREQS